MSPYISALEHCIRLLARCKQGEASLLIPNDQISQMKLRSLKNRVRHNLTHQLAELMAREIEIGETVVLGQQPDFHKGDDTRFTLRTVVMKESTFIDLQAGLNALLMEAMGQEFDGERVARGSLCTCGLVRRAIVPEEHDDSCPVILSRAAE